MKRWINYDIASSLALLALYNILPKPLVSSSQLYDINFLDDRDYDLWPMQECLC